MRKLWIVAALLPQLAMAQVFTSVKMEKVSGSEPGDVRTAGISRDGRFAGSPDKAGGEIPQTKRKVIHLHHEHTRTFSIGAVDSAIRETFKL